MPDKAQEVGVLEAVEEVVERAEDSVRHSKLVRALERVRATRTGRIILRIVLTLLGIAIVLLGLALVPLPGPGWVIVFGGLAILALEYAWARSLLQFAKEKVQAWTHWIGQQSWWVRIGVGLLTCAFVAAVLYLTLRFSMGIDLIEEGQAFLER